MNQLMHDASLPPAIHTQAPLPARDVQAEIRQAIQQIAESLAVFSSTMSLAAGLPAGAADRALRVWLLPHARQTEAAMHRLREIGAAASPAATELSQSLTVLVLLADMVASGQFVHPSDGCDMLRRNAHRAAGSLFALRREFTRSLASESRVERTQTRRL